MKKMQVKLYLFVGEWFRYGVCVFVQMFHDLFDRPVLSNELQSALGPNSCKKKKKKKEREKKKEKKKEKKRKHTQPSC